MITAKEQVAHYISRSDAIELLTEIVFDEPPYFDSETLCRLYAEEQINAIPSADVVSREELDRWKGYYNSAYMDGFMAKVEEVIVHCKDCKWYECGGLPCPLDLCESLGDDGFCSRGER